MKQVFWLVVFSLTLNSMNSYAQVEEPRKLYVGPVIGACVSKIYFFENDGLKSLPSFGYDGGVMASLKVKKKFQLNAQLLYSHRTRSIEGDGSRATANYNLKASMNFIELPIFYTLEFKNLKGTNLEQGGRQKTYNWYIGAGPVISYWLSNKGRLVDANLIENPGAHYFDFTTAFGSSDQGPGSAGKEIIPSPNRIQFGINITAGLAFEPLGFHRIMTSVHLNIMQTFMAEGPGSFPRSVPTESNLESDQLQSRNHSIRFSVGYLFDTKIEKRKRGKSTRPNN